MKQRNGFVSNSSSSSFVIVLSKLPKDKQEETKNIILKHCIPKTVEELNKIIDKGEWIDDIYNLIDYKEKDDEMHIWVRRDESMYIEELDEILYEHDFDNFPEPKFDRHY